MSGHTTEHWEIEPGLTIGYLYSVRPLGRTFLGISLPYKTDKQQARARLIAAAPDLLEALSLLFTSGSWRHHEDCVCSICKKGRAALAKATGGKA